MHRRRQRRPAPNIPAPVPGAAPVVTERITVHGASLEGNLEGDSPDRGVIVYLPPSYAKNPSRRYPVVYALHGYSINNEKWTTEIHTPQTIEGAFATGTREMIVVLADAQTKHNGSMYSNSVTTGNWEDFISHDLVAYIDSHYRTIANRASRGIAGHSMGGYGTVRIAMRHPDVYSAFYAMSPCCMSARGAPSAGGGKEDRSRGGGRSVGDARFRGRARRSRRRRHGRRIPKRRPSIWICRPRTA